MSKVWLEAWRRPGHANFGRVRDYLPFRSAGARVGLNRIGDGNLELPDSFDGFDDILLTDRDTPTNSKSSLIRLYSELDPTTPIAEWLPSEIFPSGDKDAPYTKVTGVGINGILGYARLEAFDWDGSDDFEPNQPDWNFGADNLLGNPGFDQSPITPTTWTLTIDATGGTYTLTDGVDTTAAIAFNAPASTIETRLEADITALTDLVVTEAGPGVKLIQFIDPPFGVILSINTGSLTGGSGEIEATTEPSVSPTPWTRAQRVISGTPHDIGTYDEFEVSTDQFISAPYSLLINPGAVLVNANRLGGAQQVVPVKGGALYQASIWIYPLSGTDTFRLGLFTLGEELIAWTSGAGTTFTPNTWNLVTLSDVLIPEGVDQAIFRFSCTNEFPSNPSGFYLDDAAFYEGLPPTTIGEILRLLYEDATVDHVADGRLVWEDEANPGTPYLTLDFTDTLDSNGVAWADAEISARLTMRFSYSQVMAWAANEYGYEYRVVPDDPEAGTWLWQVYNPGTMDAAPDVAIQGGAADTRRQLRRQSPGGTDTLVEGLERITSRARNTGLVTALGRIEASTLSREAAGQSAVSSAAVTAAARQLADIESVGYVLEGTLQSEPLSAYTIGDTVTIVDPPEIADLDLRLVDVEVSVTAKTVEWDVQYGSLVLTNADAAIADAVAGLLQKFEYPDVDQPEGPVNPSGGGGMAHILIVSTSEPFDIQEKADFVVTEADATFELQLIFDAITHVWSIWLAGNFVLDGDVTAPSGSWIRGLGYPSEIPT